MPPRGCRLQMLLLALLFFVYGPHEILTDTSSTGYNLELLRVTISSWSYNHLNSTMNCTDWSAILISNRSYDFFCTGELGTSDQMNYTMTGYITVCPLQHSYIFQDQQAVQPLNSLDSRNLLYMLTVYNYIDYIWGYLELSGTINQVTHSTDWKNPYTIIFEYVQSTAAVSCSDVCENATSSCDTTTSSPSPTTPTTMPIVTNATTPSTTTTPFMNYTMNTTITSTTSSTTTQEIFNTTTSDFDTTTAFNWTTSTMQTTTTVGNQTLNNTTSSTSSSTTITTIIPINSTTGTTSTTVTMPPTITPNISTDTGNDITCGICPTVSCPTCDFVQPDGNDTVPLEVYIYDTKPYKGTLAVAIVEGIILAILIVAVLCLIFWSKCAKFRRILATYAAPDIFQPPLPKPSAPKRSTSIHARSESVRYAGSPTFHNLEASPAGKLEEPDSWRERRHLRQAPSLSLTGVSTISHYSQDKAERSISAIDNRFQEPTIITEHKTRKAPPPPPVDIPRRTEEPAEVASSTEKHYATVVKPTGNSHLTPDQSSVQDPVSNNVNQDISPDYNRKINYEKETHRGTSPCNFDEFSSPANNFIAIDNIYEIPVKREDLLAAPPASTAPPIPEGFKEEDKPLPELARELSVDDDNIYEIPFFMFREEAPPETLPPPPPKETPPPENVRVVEKEVPPEVKNRNDIIRALDLDRGDNYEIYGTVLSWNPGQRPIVRKDKALSASDIPSAVESAGQNPMKHEDNIRKHEKVEDMDIPFRLLEKWKAEATRLSQLQQPNDDYEAIPMQCPPEIASLPLEEPPPVPTSLPPALLPLPPPFVTPIDDTPGAPSTPLEEPPEIPTSPPPPIPPPRRIVIDMPPEPSIPTPSPLLPLPPPFVIDMPPDIPPDDSFSPADTDFEQNNRFTPPENDYLINFLFVFGEEDEV